MFSVLLNLRLLSLRGFEDVGDLEFAELVETRARALEAEADALISGEADWASIVAEAMDVDRDRIAKAEQRACRLGHALGRSSLILADQIVACLLRATALAHGRVEVAHTASLGEPRCERTSEDHLPNEGLIGVEP